jgi:outer membrane protein OmpA-like peptidoglycan-associated protein
MKGTVFDTDTKNKLKAKFELIDLKTGDVISNSFSDAKTGEFLICIPAQNDYALNVNKKGYLFYSENFTLNDVYVHVDPFLVDVPLSPIKIGNKIILRNVFYETNSYELRRESKVELDKTVALLKQNPTVKVEISGHTDNVGAEQYNQVLSENRAKSVQMYLVEQGVHPNRMVFKGYGMSQPIEDNITEDGRKKNRRTELKITGI